jgi:general stress protein 26
MNDDDPERSLFDLLRAGSTVMVGTESPRGDLQFRPLTVARVGGVRVEILLDSNEEWARSFTDGDRVYVTMSDTRANTWLSMAGSGRTTADPNHIDELWNPFASAYFDRGRETPGIAVMMIDVDDGRYWSAPSGRIGSLISMVKAKLGGAESSGEHGDITL